jgi:molybdenum cofactor cytidylyltransferase
MPACVAAVLLAAGRSSRMGRNKLLIAHDGRTLLDRSLDAALASACSSVLVVIGHEAAAMRARLAGRPVEVVENPDYAEGLSTSLRAGIASLDAEIAAAIICLADMPEIGAALLDRMIEAWRSGAAIVVPMRDGRRGNPVLWDRRHFPALRQLAGDQGARRLIETHAADVAMVPAEDDGIFIDVDTPEALARWGESRR